MEPDPHPGRENHLPRHRCGHRRPHPLLHREGQALHRIRIPPSGHAHPLRDAPRELPLERTGDVAAQAGGVPHLARRGELRDAVVQAAHGPRIPPRRPIQQPQPGRHQGPELHPGPAGIDHRPALPAHLAARGRRRHVGDRHVLLRAGAATLLHARVPGPRTPAPRPPQPRQVVLRLLPRIRPRPLPAGLPDRRLRLRPLRREHLGQGGLVQHPQPLPPLHHADSAQEVLRHQRTRALRRDLPAAERLLGADSRAGLLVGADPRTGRAEPHRLPVARGAGRHDLRGREERPRPDRTAGRHRQPHRTGAAHRPHGRPLHPARSLERQDLVDGVPAFEALRAAGQFATLLSGPRGGTSPHRQGGSQRPLPHRDGPGRNRLGRVHARRPLHGGPQAQGVGHAPAPGPLFHRDTRHGVGQRHPAALRADDRRRRHAHRHLRRKRPLRTRHPQRLRHPERPAGPRRQATTRRTCSTSPRGGSTASPARATGPSTPRPFTATRSC